MPAEQAIGRQAEKSLLPTRQDMVCGAQLTATALLTASTASRGKPALSSPHQLEGARQHQGSRGCGEPVLLARLWDEQLSPVMMAGTPQPMA